MKSTSTTFWTLFVLIERYTKEIVETMFLEDTMRQDAVARQLEVIGEASRQLSESLRDDHSDIPWQAIIALRNLISSRLPQYRCACDLGGPVRRSSGVATEG